MRENKLQTALHSHQNTLIEFDCPGYGKLSALYSERGLRNAEEAGLKDTLLVGLRTFCVRLAGL